MKEEIKKTIPNINKLEAKCNHISEMERKANKASRASIKYMQCVYLKDSIGKIFNGIVTSVTEYGVFVNIPSNGYECLVKLSSINGTWQSDVKTYSIKEFNTGEIIRLGDSVTIVITNVDVEKKNIDATLIRL